MYSTRILILIDCNNYFDVPTSRKIAEHYSANLLKTADFIIFIFIFLFLDFEMTG